MEVACRRQKKAHGVPERLEGHPARPPKKFQLLRKLVHSVLHTFICEEIAQGHLALFW